MKGKSTVFRNMKFTVKEIQKIKRQLAVRTYLLVLKVTKICLQLKTGSFVPEKKKNKNNVYQVWK